ncbi:MAG: hypothetical protein IJO96_07340 [Oscillospiraceae bacterium]|nr:hypothetical protein [Oscillospiraceae bacterium]
MKTIYDVDKNFKANTNFNKEDIVFYDVREKPFNLYGLFWENGKFRRLPEAVAKATNEGVHFLHANSAGGRVRFKTDSPYVAVFAKIGDINKGDHGALTGTAGFDIYSTSEDGQVFEALYHPSLDIVDKVEAIAEFDCKKMRELTLNLPLYSEVCELYLGLAEGCTLEEASPYKYQCPVVYYGSSITQGGCASRPGTCYQGLISRRFDCDYINLGFSGSARGEDVIAEYIADLDMSLFVYDYDHNAPTVEHLANTHERMFRIIREKNPTLPIIMLTRPRVMLAEHEKERLKIVERTYQNAVAAGDKNVYFISGAELMKYCGDEGTVDKCHPTDYGFASMAKVLGDLMATIYFK